MPLKRVTLEFQLELAKGSLNRWIAKLEAKGIAKDSFRRNPRWRQLNARCNQIKRRLARVAEIEAINKEVAERKAAKLAASTTATA